MRIISLFLSASLWAPVFHVVLDAGHDPVEPGVTKGQILEKDWTLILSKELAASLSGKKEIQAVLTRKGDYPLSFDERRRIANTNEPGVMLSLHLADSVRIYLLSGIQIPDPGRFVPMDQAHLKASADSLVFADLLKEELLPSFPGTEIDVTFRALAPILGVQLPAVLVEAPVLSDPAQRASFSGAITRAIDRMRNEGKDPSP